MKRIKENSKPTYFVEILSALIFLYIGVDGLVTGDAFHYHGSEIPVWTGWITIPVCLYILYIVYKARWRDRQEAKKDADAAALEEQEREAQGDIADGKNECESKKDEPPQGGA